MFNADMNFYAIDQWDNPLAVINNTDSNSLQ